MEGVCREHTLFRLQFTAFWDFVNKKLFNPRPVPPNTEVFSVFHPENLCVTSVTSQSDCQIQLQSQVSQAHVEDYLSSIHIHPQVSSQLNKFRIYLNVARQLDYSISNEMTKVRLMSWNHYFKKSL